MAKRLLPAVFLLGILLFVAYYLTLSAPASFPNAAYVKVRSGMSLEQVGQQLEQEHIVRSGSIFVALAKIYGGGVQAVAGEYFFPAPENVVVVAWRLARGYYELTPVRVTIPEGASSQEMGDELNQKLADFDEATFLKEAKPKEGYLFPDTYFFLPGEDPETVISAMQSNFNEHIQASSTQDALTSFGKPLSDVIIMASLLEKEASDTHDRRVIAGILWKRVQIGMPLQVDAVFPYIIGKNSLDLTTADLKTDSPYNTYLYKGLPPGPIANPGMDAIMDAMTPIKTSYLYYLSDLQGNFHYCATYACQEANAAKYLNH